MERNLVAWVGQVLIRRVLSLTPMQNPHMPTYRTSNIHLDILMGRDEAIEPADFMTPSKHRVLPNHTMRTNACSGGDLTIPLSVHAEMQKRRGM